VRLTFFTPGLIQVAVLLSARAFRGTPCPPGVSNKGTGAPLGRDLRVDPPGCI